IGTNKDGTWTAQASGAYLSNGVSFEPGSHDNRLGTDGRKGGLNQAERNIITGNGINVGFGWTSSNNAVAGNFIGTFRDGVTGLSDGGLYLDGSNNRIGTNGDGIGDADEGNLISHTSGIRVAGGIGHTIRGNSIVDNDGSGIDLSNDGTTQNDPLDADTGPNGFQNFPVLSSVIGGATTHVTGTLNSTPNATFTLDFYANRAYDRSGYGEGERWLGFTTVTTGPDGNASFDV